MRRQVPDRVDDQSQVVTDSGRERYRSARCHRGVARGLALPSRTDVSPGCARRPVRGGSWPVPLRLVRS
jgi:hypothetical protein